MRNYPLCRVCGKPTGNYNIKTHRKCCRGKNHHNAKPIVQCDKDGYIVTKWNALIEIERITGMAEKSIRRALKGERKTAYKFIWKYEM